nr:uncharacterized protein CTRU02_13843 [Colletotrichum truncatum]KAF6782845.1 hypothetical protein CTRU02_13843 [Colletotrichum truncatum]
MWFFQALFRRLLDDCKGIDLSGEVFWPEKDDKYYLGDQLPVSLYAGKSDNYTNSTTALWNIWLQDAQYEEKTKQGTKAYRSNVCYVNSFLAKNFTYGGHGADWLWRSREDVCNNTLIACYGNVPRDITAADNAQQFVVVAIREATNGNSASTGKSNTFTVMPSVNPTESGTAKTACCATGAGATVTGGVPSETSAASSGADSGGISPAVKAGLAVVGVVVFLGLVGLLCFVWWRRRKQKKLDAATVTDGEGGGQYLKPELDGQGVVAEKKTVVVSESNPDHIAELDGGQPMGQEGVDVTFKEEKSQTHIEEAPRAELGGGGAHSELEANQPWVELGSDEPRAVESNGQPEAK